MKRLRGLNHSGTVNKGSRDICGWVKAPCWSYRHTQSSTWLNTNCGPPSASILIISIRFSTMFLLRIKFYLSSLFSSRAAQFSSMIVRAGWNKESQPPLKTRAIFCLWVTLWHLAVKCTLAGYNIYTGTKLRVQTWPPWGTPQERQTFQCRKMTG